MLAVSGFLRLRSGQALRLRDCEERNRSAQDDRFVGEWAGSRFLAALGMTERKARARASAEADPCGMTTRKARAGEGDPGGMTTRKATADAGPSLR